MSCDPILQLWKLWLKQLLCVVLQRNSWCLNYCWTPLPWLRPLWYVGHARQSANGPLMSSEQSLPTSGPADLCEQVCTALLLAPAASLGSPTRAKAFLCWYLSFLLLSSLLNWGSKPIKMTYPQIQTPPPDGWIWDKHGVLSPVWGASGSLSREKLLGSRPLCSVPWL